MIVDLIEIIEKNNEIAIMKEVDILKARFDDIQREIEFYTEERDPGSVCYWALEMKRLQQQVELLIKGTDIDSSYFKGCIEKKSSQSSYLGLPIEVQDGCPMLGHRIREAAYELLSQAECVGERFTLLVSSHDFVRLELDNEIDWSSSKNH